MKIQKIKTFFKSNFFFAVIAGSLSTFSFAPFNIFIAAIISLSIFYFLLEDENENKSTFWLGFFYGFGFFLAGNYWIAIPLFIDAQQFAWLTPLALTALPASVAIYHATFAITYKKLLNKFKFFAPTQKIIIFATLWTLFEIIRTHFLYNGFPWNLLGYSWMFSEKFSQVANIFGIYGLSFLAALTCLLPTLFANFKNKKISFHKPKLRENIFAAAISLILASGFCYGAFYIDESKLVIDEKNKIRLVQTNITPNLKWDNGEKFNNLQNAINLTKSKPNLDQLSAVIWSETTVPYALEQGTKLLEILTLATPQNGTLITGALRADFENGDLKNIWNSVFTIAPGKITDFYDKHHLVPFGEYVPLQLEKIFPFIANITGGGSGFSAGLGAKTIHQENSFSFSPSICYEIIFPDKIIDSSNRPDLLLNVTNDVWFGESSEAYQHLNMARMRSIEHGISMARVANHGITAFIDPFGRIIDHINLNQEGTIDVNLIKKLEPTIYEKYGNEPLLLLIAAMLTFLISLPRPNVNRQNYAYRHPHR